MLLQDESDDEPRAVNAGLTANEDLAPRVPALGCVGSDLAKAVQVIRIDLCVREPIPDLLNAPRCRVCVGVERDDEVEGTLAPVVAWLGWLTEQT